MPPRVRGLRFLLSRRWVLLLLLVLLFAYACLLLGRWQWHRLESKKAGNAIIRANERATPRPVDEVLRPGADPSSAKQYAVVSATGTYDTSKTVIIRYQTREAASGVDVVVPLMTSSGTALLVDRGWFATSNKGLTDASQVPAPPSGKVTVTGWVRQNAEGGATQVIDASARAISSDQIEPAIGIPVYGGFIQMLTESPQATTTLKKPEPPDLTNGPHFFYALQWWFFGILGLFGYGYLAWEEFTGRADLRRSQQPAKKTAAVAAGGAASIPSSQRTHDAAVDGQHRPADERRGRTEQEGRGTGS